MTRKRIFIIAVLALIGGLLLAAFWRQALTFTAFAKEPLPALKSYRLFDIGVTDVDNDGWMDIFTSNHHFRQVLWLADGKGGFQDKLSELGLDQDRTFPDAELAFRELEPDRPGLYLFWFGGRFVLLAHDIQDPQRYRGTLVANEHFDVFLNNGDFQVEITPQKSKVSTSQVSFMPSTKNGRLVLEPGGQGLPFVFEFGDEVDLDKLYVGYAKIHPKTRRFTITMQDRHALAWSDYDDDGRKDVFIDRGALGGRLRAYPREVQMGVHDELLVTGGDARYEDISAQVGFYKNGCSGRHARWVDFDGDGRLDIFINCYNRHNALTLGEYPKQLYRQLEDGRFQDVAAKVGLAMPDLQFGNLVFLDADGDGDKDFIGVTDEGVVMLRNDQGRFQRQVLYTRNKVEGKRVGSTTGDRWLFDGKLTVADHGNDGDLDLFVASKRGNLLLENRGGTFVALPVEVQGLAAASWTANWVDYDNDGWMDLHLVPQGLYRQRPDGTFEATGLLAFPEVLYRAAIANWTDLNNDGQPDVVMALSRDPAYEGWRSWLEEPDRPHWLLSTYLNRGDDNHWLAVELAGPKGNREGIGARVTLTTALGRQLQEVGTTDGAFFSQGNYRLHFGLGDQEKVAKLTVEWPDGRITQRNDLAVDRLVRIEP